ncbi:MAG: hypothetical protein ACWGQW_10805, partial [bacterium]
MSLLSGRDVRRATHLHSRTVEIEVRTTRGQLLTLDTLPPWIDGTVNFVDEGIRRRANVTFETQSPSRDFTLALQDDNASWIIKIDGIQL